MKKFKVMLSVFMVCILVFLSVVSTFAVSVVDVKEKITDELNVVIDENNGELISVYIFLKNCDKSEVYTNLEKKYDYNIEAYENPELYYNEVVPNIVVNKQTIKEILKDEKATPKVLSLDNEESSVSVATRKEINKAMVDDMNGYLGKYRKEVSNVIDTYVSKFIDDNKELIEKVTIQSSSAEFIVADVQAENIQKIAKSQYVSRISLYEDVVFEPYAWNATSVTQSDYDTGLGSELYNYGSGYDGTGVNIGIIETGSGRYNSSNYNLTDADVTFLLPPGSGTAYASDHATNVTALVCGKKVTINGKKYGGPATGATVYQTGIWAVGELYDAIDMLIDDYNVNVINMSLGEPYDASVDPSYGALEKTIDDIIENKRVTFVIAAGNADDNPNGVITSPGNSYNSIVVGNVMTKYYDQILSPPFPMHTGSFYSESSYLANKPDVVAPGTKLNLPTSDNSIGADLFGNSYSAPIVTGIVAQLMQDSVTALGNPNAVKNFIVCGADSTAVTGDTVSYGVLKDRSGAGLVNAVNSFEIMDAQLENYYYGVYSASKTTPTEYETIATLNLSKGDNLRAALTFEKEENILLTSEYGNNIDIRLVRGNANSSYCVASESTNNNVELIDTKITTTGTYVLQIRLTDSILTTEGNDDLHYWVSWRTY